MGLAMPREIDTLKSMMRARAAERGAASSIEEMRRQMAQATAGFSAPPDVSVSATELGGVSGLRFTPTRAAEGRVLLYFHGGGYVLGSAESHRALVANLAHLAGIEAVSLNYRLAPEHPCPAAVEDGVAAYRALINHGRAPQAIVVGGDSAGGGLAVSTLVQARAQGLAMPAGALLLSPWVNLGNGGWSYQSRAEADPMVTRAGLDNMAQLYLGQRSPQDPVASPVHADLSGLPPLLIQVGGDEILLSDSVSLAERAGAAGVPATLEVWPEMIHVFQALADFLGDARCAQAGLAEWTRKRLGLPPST